MLPTKSVTTRFSSRTGEIRISFQNVAGVDDEAVGIGDRYTMRDRVQRRTADAKNLFFDRKRRVRHDWILLGVEPSAYRAGRRGDCSGRGSAIPKPDKPEPTR